MSIDKLFPAADGHAILNAAFVIEWAEPLTIDLVHGLAKLATKFKNSERPLLQMLPQQTVEFSLGAQDSGQAISHGLSGYLFFEPAVDQSHVRSVSISRQNCIIVITDYSRWIEVWAQVQNYLKIALEYVGPKRPLNVIGLQYTDKFNWRDDPDELDLTEVFSGDAYLPANALKQKGLWHSHHGFLEAQELPVPHNRLENVNVDVNEAGGERVFQVTTSHRVTLKTPLWQSHLKNEQVVYDIFDRLHDANKDMLSKLLTPGVCEKINLNVS